MKFLKKYRLIILFLLTIYMVAITMPMTVMNLSEWADKPYSKKDWQSAREWCQTQLRKGEKLPKITDSEWKQKVNNLIGSNFYLEVRKTIFNVHGQAIIYANTVLVDGVLTGVEYAKVLLHELVHLKKFEGNERKTSWTAFKLSYKSDDPYMNYVSASTALTSLCIRDNYSFNGHLIKFLKEKDIIK